ncbi:hypothetical protein BHU72_06965 [Desulfuribacillus stibiiarsenatis]|uniref:Hydrogenase maturation protease n=1 Tax=Desulfuribacillus stibiiarsenatis TaxID=1390249 RepID=A0A1E5L4A8_9FIRM|nr:hydrogenase maturation protease [Desulfuribacillus stibiiarsenatis]OEH84926.1 hypothetical protein BHU72_06965 [Desulfuribacillus stibiiarsenatis]
MAIDCLRTTTESPKVAIIGIGNLLLGDDGVGVHAIQQLEQGHYGVFPNHVDFVDGGTFIFDMLDVFTQYKKIIIIDCLKGGHKPGTVYHVTPKQLGETIRETSSLHEVQILDIVQWMEYLGHNLDVEIVGIEPESIGYSMELSATVQDALTLAVDRVKKILE